MKDKSTYLTTKGVEVEGIKLIHAGNKYFVQLYRNIWGRSLLSLLLLLCKLCKTLQPKTTIIDFIILSYRLFYLLIHSQHVTDLQCMLYIYGVNHKLNRA